MGKRKKNLYEEIWNRLVGKRIYVFCEGISYSRRESHSSETGRTIFSFSESFTGPILIVGKLIDHDNICVTLEVEEVKSPSSVDYLDHVAEHPLCSRPILFFSSTSLRTDEKSLSFSSIGGDV